MGQAVNYRKVIEDARKAGSIIDPSFFKAKEARDALYQLNKESASKLPSPVPSNPYLDEIEKEKKRKAKFGG